MTGNWPFSSRSSRPAWGGGRDTIGSTRLEHERRMAEPAYSWANRFRCLSELMSTTPSTTLIAVSSSIKYAGTGGRHDQKTGVVTNLLTWSP